jgi:hypothetical protein
MIGFSVSRKDSQTVRLFGVQRAWVTAGGPGDAKAGKVAPALPVFLAPVQTT